jgi:2-aminoadipate transaminase
MFFDHFDDFLSQTALSSKRSVIRELLKLINNPEIISFAGGLPSPEAFPIDDIKRITSELIEKEGAYMMQYGATEGDTELRRQLIKKANKDGMDAEEHNLLVTTASQQALDLVAKVFIDRGDPIIVGVPTYLGGLSAFKSYGADIHGVTLDDEGMSAVKLEKELKALQKAGKKAKFIYIVPDFQNPSGITMTKKRRLEVLDIANKYETFIVEDSPYRDLRYKGEHVPTLHSLDKSRIVILLGTFSKIFIPGFRIGWAFAHKQIIDKLTMAKQATDLCSSPFNQRIAAEYLKEGLLEKQIEKIKKLYNEKMKLMLEQFEKHMPDGVTWTEPEGGLFLMVTVPEHIDLEKEFQKAIDRNVAYVIGSAFTHNNSRKNTMRINFSYSNHKQIKTGVERLADMIKSLM